MISQQVRELVSHTANLVLDCNSQSTITTPQLPRCAYESAPGGEVPQHLRNLLGEVFQRTRQGKYEAAECLCVRAVKDIEKKEGPNHPDVALLLNVLAVTYRNQKKYKEAIVLLKKVLTIREKLHGKNDLSVAAALNNIAFLHSKTGEYTEAEPLFIRALEIRKKVLGEDHPDVAWQLNNLALAYTDLENFEEAELYFTKALQIYDAKLGPSHQIVFKTMNNFAFCYLKMKKYENAEVLYKKILTRAHEKQFGVITENNKSIWQVAEENKNKFNNSSHGIPTELLDASEFESPIIIATLKKLKDLYLIQNKNKAAEILGKYTIFKETKIIKVKK